MLIRQAFQTFLMLQSDVDRPSADTEQRPAGVARAWPMDHTPRLEARDWTVDWRWFATDAFQE